jgi:ribonucleoside-diphosphate reductase subunit M2
MSSIEIKSVFDRLTSLLPVQDLELYSYYDKAARTFWTHDEVDLSTDIVQWKEKLSDDEKYFLSHILAFFVQSDQLVNINLGDRFLVDIDSLPDHYRKYCRLFYNFQTMIEDVHTLSYETMLNEYIPDPKMNAHYKQAITNIPVITRKAEWAAHYITDQKTEYPIRLIAFAILEGIFFSGSFCSIFWIEQKNLLRGLTRYNKFISRDEKLHYDFALCLFRKLRDDPNIEFNVSNDTITQMVSDAVAIEIEFINESIPCAMIGMNADLMGQYIKYVADCLLIDIQLKPIFNAKNPFSFMMALGIQDRANFFEEKETIYSKPINSGIEYDSDASDF